jgi:hypothetical protein
MKIMLVIILPHQEVRDVKAKSKFRRSKFDRIVQENFGDRKLFDE